MLKNLLKTAKKDLSDTAKIELPELCITGSEKVKRNLQDFSNKHKENGFALW